MESANLVVSYGRRYGLCGRNGIGKSTLLKMISNNWLEIPKHISILHLEQEVVGDDTLAIESVLEADFKRHRQSAEEKQLLNCDQDKDSLGETRFPGQKIFRRLFKDSKLPFRLEWIRGQKSSRGVLNA